MKRIKLLSLIVVLGAILTLSSCEDYFCVHRWGDWTVVQESSCTSLGIMERECDICGRTETSKIEYLDHVWARSECGENMTCSSCGAIGEVSEHELTDASTPYVRTCKYCGIDECSAFGHSWRESTCSTDQICMRCGENAGNRKPHDNVHYDAKEATCTENGYREYSVCESCGYSTYCEIKATGHSYGDDMVCDSCGYERQMGEGLEYTLHESGQYYIISSIGTCIDEHLVIPDSYESLPIKEIAARAFDSYSNTALKSVTVPGSVEIIGDYAFAGEIDLAQVRLESGVRVIGNHAFFGCETLTSVQLPATVESIGDRAFGASLYLTELLLDEDNEHYKLVDGVLYTADGTILMWYSRVNDAQDFEIPSGVTHIAPFAFAGTRVENVILPDGVTDIGDYAFYGCRLSEINLPSALVSIGGESFAACELLERIVIPIGVSDIGAFAFSDCYNLTVCCEAEKMPDGWSIYFANDCKIVWGYKEQ